MSLRAAIAAIVVAFTAFLSLIFLAPLSISFALVVGMACAWCGWLDLHA